MSNFTDFFPAAGGGGGIPKYEEFTANGTWTPSQELIDAGGRISYLVVGGGAGGPHQGSSGQYTGAAGGEVKIGYNTLTSTTALAITIGAGGAQAVYPNTSGTAGADSIAAFATAGGTTITASGGSGANNSANDGNNWGATSGTYSNFPYASSAHPGYMGIYGRGGAAGFGSGGGNPIANTGSGGGVNTPGAAGFVRITWFE